MQLTAELLEDYDAWKTAQDYPEKSPEGFLDYLTMQQRLANRANVLYYIDSGVYDDLPDKDSLLVSIRADLMQDV